MLKSQENKLLRLTEENNKMLKCIIKYINQKDNNSFAKDFGINLVANVLGSKLTNRIINK